MTKTIEMADLFEPVEIGLWGQSYEVLSATKQIESKVAAATPAVVAADAMKPAGAEDTEDDVSFFSDSEMLKKVTAYVDAVDAVLKPIDNETDDGGTAKAPRAKAHLLKLYKANEIGWAHIDATFEQVFDAFRARNRPTRPFDDQSES